MKPIGRILEGQVALITGGSSGIGKAIAEAMALAGAAVLINYHSDDTSAREMVAKIRSAGGKALCCGADVSQEEQVQAMFAAALEEFGTLDILVSNAGIQQDAPFLEMSLEQWRKVLDVNLTGAFLCAREAAREFCRRGVVAGALAGSRQDPLHQFGARGDPLGRARQLRHLQGGHHAADEEPGPGAGPLPHPGQQPRTRRPSRPTSTERPGRPRRPPPSCAG